MHDALRCPGRLRASLRTAALSTVLCVIGGCANTNWERGVYEGLRRSPNTGERAGKPAPAIDASLPDYTRYEQERQRLRAKPKSTDAAAVSAARPASAPASAP